MITDRIHTLITHLVDEMMSTYLMEREFGDILRSLDEPTLREIAYLIEDQINNHPRKPVANMVQFSRIERYIAHHLRRADWQCQYDDLMAEAAKLDDYEHDIFADLDEDDPIANDPMFPSTHKKADKGLEPVQYTAENLPEEWLEVLQREISVQREICDVKSKI